MVPARAPLGPISSAPSSILRAVVLFSSASGEIIWVRSQLDRLLEFEELFSFQEN
jgi:hypothetical protein